MAFLRRRSISDEEPERLGDSDTADPPKEERDAV